MADLLGGVDVDVSTTRPAPVRTVRLESRRKTRVLSPPISQSRAKSIDYNRTKTDVHNPGTPPARLEYDDDIGLPNLGDDNDVIMSDQPMPSSPVLQAVERKSQTGVVKAEEEDEDLMEVAQAVGHKGVATTSVNISGSRPAPKIKKNDYPTPNSSSPTKPPADFIDPSTWSNVTSNLNLASGPAMEPMTAGKLQASDVVEEDGSIRFFWMDYTELNGSLLLFGKVKNKRTNQHVSCFVKVDNIMRKLFFLPREHRQIRGVDTNEEVDMSNVYDEVASLMSKLGVGMHKIKPCSRKYAFELPDIPKEADYLKLLYPYDKPALLMDLKGDTFSQVFGANTSLFEQFVLWKNIMGPCWLKIEDGDFDSITNASWCKLELGVKKPELISSLGDSDNLEAPPLTLASVALRTMMNVKENKQEIIMASIRIYENVSLSDTTPADKLPCKTLTVMRPIGAGFPTGFATDVEKHVGAVRLEKTEQGLLAFFLANLQKIDPDVLIGHRLEDLDYSILLSRLKDRNTPGWHRIGRLRRREWPKNMGKGGGSFFAERQLIAGRLLCDLANDQGKVSVLIACALGPVG